ncbi:MAG: flavodoxin, partial [Treponema sp.]|nr:flavodoxin [Treponema sp.]
PYYIGNLPRDAEAFLAAHRQALSYLPTAIAAFGPLGEGKAVDRSQLEATLGKHPWLKPVSAGLFGGVYDPAGLRGLDRLLAALPASPLHGLSARDDLDRTALRLWAEELAKLLRD